MPYTVVTRKSNTYSLLHRIKMVKEWQPGVQPSMSHTEELIRLLEHMNQSTWCGRPAVRDPVHGSYVDNKDLPEKCNYLKHGRDNGQNVIASLEKRRGMSAHDSKHLFQLYSLNLHPVKSTESKPWCQGRQRWMEVFPRSSYVWHVPTDLAVMPHWPTSRYFPLEEKNKTRSSAVYQPTWTL